MRTVTLQRTSAAWMLLEVVASFSLAAPPKFNPEKLAAIAPGMQRFVDQQEICGAVLLIGTSEGIVYHEAIGKRTLDSDATMPKDAIFRIMSMTKPMTAMGLMMLVDEGKASIDDPVEKHLPEFTGQMMVASTDRDAGTTTLRKPSRPITIKDLLTHTAGQPEYPQGFATLMRRRDHTLADMALISSQRPLEFEPGTKWKYSSAGIDVLGRLIEVFSGQPYEDFLAQRIFEPLEMQDTGFYLTRKQADRLAQLCAKQGGKLVPSTERAADPLKKPRFPSPAGGLYSTAADLAKAYQGLLNGGQYRATRFIAEDTLQQMTRNQVGDLRASFTPGMSCGLGFHLVSKPQGVTGMLSPGTFGHGGAFGTQSWIDPVRDVFYVLLIQRAGLPNSDGSDIRREFQTLAAAAVEP